MPVNSYQDLTVWQKAMDLAEVCYHLTKAFPKEEMYGMVTQIRRASSSVPANIAEGWGRGTTGEYIQFLRVAQGSLKELETHLLLAQRVGLTTEQEVNPALQLLSEVSRMIISLIGSLRRKQL
jgi:four helix bundle protein